MTDAAAPAEKRAPTPEELFAFHQKLEGQRKAASAEKARLAERLTRAYAERALVFTIGGERVAAHFPAREVRHRLVNVLRELRVRSERHEAGEVEPVEEQERLDAAVYELAAELTVDEELTADFFAKSEYGAELAVAVLLGVEGALSRRTAEAATFRSDA